MQPLEPGKGSTGGDFCERRRARTEEEELCSLVQALYYRVHQRYEIPNSNRSGPEEAVDRRIYRGSENRIRMLQKYTHQFHCSFYLDVYPFDRQVQ